MARHRLDHGAAVAVAVACVAIGSPACIVSLDGLTGGPGDAGPDVTSDSTVAPLESSSESSSPVDSATDARRPVEAAPVDAGCVPSVFDGGSSVACPAQGPDGSACYAQAVPSFQPKWIPPRPPVASCTATQVSNFTMDCLGSAPVANCNTFQMDSANAACLGCLISPMSPPQQQDGPLLQGMNFELLNVGGCIALADPCQMPCAAAWEAKQQCEEAACGPVCPVTDATTGAAYEACITQADTCSCLSEATVAEDCAQALVVGPAALCFPSSGFVNATLAFGMLFCGG